MKFAMVAGWFIGFYMLLGILGAPPLRACVNDRCLVLAVGSVVR